MDEVRFEPIGEIHSPFTETTDMPIQAVAAKGVAGRVELFPAYRDALRDALRDIEGFSHLILLYHLHLSWGRDLTVTPFLDDVPRGVFATRSPRRPNPIGLSTVRLVQADEATLHIEDVDVVDGTPLLDMKPYVPAFDDRAETRIGWFEGKVGRVHEVRADERFRL